MTLQIYLIGDDPVFMAGLQAIVDQADMMNVAGIVALRNSRTTAPHCLEPYPHVVIISSAFPSRALSDLIQEMITRCPPRAEAPKFLVISHVDDDDAVVAALRAGARGYLVDVASLDDLVRSIHIIADGGAVFCSVVAERLRAYFSAVHDLPGRVAFPELTDREREVLDLIAHGLGNHQIARKLVLAEKTVRNHITHIFLKLQVSDRTAAAARARDAGLGV
jgi:DNA-binding NarL/FixJ family response regulator